VSDWVVPLDQVADSMAAPDRKKTGQDNKRVSQPWHQFSHIITNCLAHDYHFRFTEHDNRKLTSLGNDDRKEDPRRPTDGHVLRQAIILLR
jgi:hypothetical protein